MNRNDFIKMIRDTGQVDRQMTGEVKELVNLFPWFQSAHLLLLKGLHNAGDVRFENQLKQSAIHIADREVLYYMLQQESMRTETATLIQPEKDEIKPWEAKESDVKSEESIDNQQVVIDTGKNSQDIIVALERNSALSDNQSSIHQDNPSQTVLVIAESETDESASIVLTIDDGETHFQETVIFMDPSIIVIREEEELLELDEGEIELPENRQAAFQTEIPVKPTDDDKKDSG